ncbi:MAG TPA: hypothetical protein V6C97_20425 [Oculatellaceae cyanobacterium]
MVSRATGFDGAFAHSLTSTGDSSAAFQNELAQLQKPGTGSLVRSGLSPSAAFTSDLPASAAADIPSLVPAVSDSAVSTPPSFADSSTWPQIQPVLASAKGVDFTSAADNAKSGAQPDYFLGADGKLVPNPNKTTPSPDGKVNIQIEGNKAEIDAKKLASDLQKQSIRDLIGYFKRDNPGAKIPQYWLDILNSQPDLPNSTQTADNSPQPQQSYQPTSPSDYGPSAPAGAVPQGDQRVGNADVGQAPSSGYRRGEFSDNPTPGDSSAIPPPVPGDLNICLNGHQPSCTVEQIQKFLENVGSPAAKEQGFAQTLYDEGIKHNIDPAVAVGFFLQESTCGRYGHAHYNHSVGNIKGEGTAGTDGEFRRYNTWSEGAKDWYNLIDNHYVHGRNLESLSQIIHVYAPNGDASNNEREYASVVKGVVKGFQQENLHAQVATNQTEVKNS